MKVKRQALEAGSVLAEDVYSKTKQPIICEDTVLTDQHLQVLEAFLIDEVVIEAKTPDGEKSNSPNHSNEVEREKSRFVESYSQVVKQYKQWFGYWQSGQKVDVYAIRRTFISLIEEAVTRPDDVFSLHHYATKQDYLYHHAVSTAVISAFLGKNMSYSQGDWLQIGLAGALSDCGMAKIPLAFLHKQEPLTVRERNEVIQHPVYSFQMLKSIPSLKEGVLLAVSQHHERENGSGYPLGISTEQIHPFSKIVAMADSFHAMACERSYRERRSAFQVLEMLSQELGSFDLSVIRALNEGLVRFSVGTKVRLTNNQLAEIVFIPQRTPTRPIVRLKENEEIVPLVDHPKLSIETVLT